MGNKDKTIKIDPLNKPKAKPTTKRKLKYKFKRRHIILISAFVVVLAIGIYLMSSYAVGTGKPVEGDRCAGIQTIEKEKIEAVTETIKATHPQIERIETSTRCKEFKMSLHFVEGTSAPDAKAISNNAMALYDAGFEAPKTEGRNFSNLFYQIEDKPQYDVVIYIYGNAPGLPIMGTKQHTVDAITYVDATPVNQSLHDSLRQEYLDKEAEKEKEENPESVESETPAE